MTEDEKRAHVRRLLEEGVCVAEIPAKYKSRLPKAESYPSDGLFKYKLFQTPHKSGS